MRPAPLKLMSRPIWSEETDVSPLQSRPAACPGTAPSRIARCAMSLLATAGLLSGQSSDALKHSIAPPPSGVQSSALFGTEVAMTGTYVVIGVPADDTAGSGSGLVKVFDASTGALLHVLNNPRPNIGASFGSSVAISGSRVVVGARGSDSAGSVDSGTAYLFNLATATPTVPVAEFTYPSPAPGDDFGAAVTIDGLNIAIAATDKNVGGQTDTGAVYLYSLTSATPTVPVMTFNNPSPDAYDRYGNAVALSSDILVIGCQNDDLGQTSSGIAYVYDLAGATPTNPVHTLQNPSPAAYDYFGSSVAVAAGNRIAVGAEGDDTAANEGGSVYVFELSSATPTIPVHAISGSTAGASFGADVDLWGQKLLIGFPGSNQGEIDSGSAHLYDLGSGSPTTPSITFHNPDPAYQDKFGTAVAIADTRVAIGVPYDDTGAGDAGAAYLYDTTSGTPSTPAATIYHASPANGDSFGSSVGNSGSRVVVGAPLEDTSAQNSGGVHVYNLATATPTTPVLSVANPNPSISDKFGEAVAISGLRFVASAPLDDIGATDAGRAYVFNLASPTPSTPDLTLNNPSPEANDQFGNAIAFSGNRIVVGEQLDNTGATDAGKVHVYDTTSGTPTLPIHTLTNPNPAEYDRFGAAVSISGTRVVVGAPSDDSAGPTDSGRVFVYDLSGSTPTVPVLTLAKPGAASRDRFGDAVAVSGTRIAVGAPGDDSGGADAGVVYVFDTAGSTPSQPVAIIPNPNSAAANQFFGSELSLSGSILTVGTPEESLDAGSVFVFDVSRATPTVPILTLRKDVPVNNDRFGAAVSVDGTAIAVGISGDDRAVADKGYVQTYGSPTTSTGVPTLAAPVSGAAFGSSVQVNYTLPEAALPGTAKLVFRSGATSRVLTLASSREASGNHAFAFDAANPTSGGNIVGSSAIPDGTYDVALSYQDALGSVAASSNVASGVVISSVLPQVSPPAGGFTPLAVVAGTNLADYRPQAVVYNGSGVVSFTQSPAPGTVTTVGAIPVTLTVTGASGPPSVAAFTVNAVSAANDTDGDGMNDAAEVRLSSFGFNWQVNQTAAVNTFYNNANQAGLYTTSQIQALNVDVPLLTRDPGTGIFKLTLGVRKSTDLETFVPFPMSDPQTIINPQGKLDFYFTSPDDAAFFRVEAE